METQRLLFLAVLLLSSSQTEADVVKFVSECAQFFLGGTPPQIAGVLEGGNIENQTRYQPICQAYKDQRRFFTLYDTTNKIPVFSAYKYTGAELGDRTQASSGYNWRTEKDLNQDQAQDDDYKIDYDRGHLFPKSYGYTEDDKCSTFTLTNAVPQARSFNQGSWSNMENCVRSVMKKHCINEKKEIEGFLVTGAEPGTEKLKDKINIPSVMWSAFCCKNSENQWLASAYWADNVPEENGTKILETKNLNQLQQQFSRIKVFPDTPCPPDTTVTDLYKGLNECKSMSPTAGSSAGAGGRGKAGV